MRFLSLFRRKQTPDLNLLSIPRPEPDANVVVIRIDEVQAVAKKISQLTFLLSQCPILDVTLDFFSPSGFARRSVTPYAYIHPETFVDGRRQGLLKSGDIRLVGPSLTKWVLTDLMPKGRVIFSPNPMPGVQP